MRIEGGNRTGNRTRINQRLNSVVQVKKISRNFSSELFKDTGCTLDCKGNLRLNFAENEVWGLEGRGLNQFMMGSKVEATHTGKRA